MSGEPQLERSVLEGKERDKLQAIAEALGLKPTARAKKADLIDGILRDTGDEAAPPAEAEAARPRRATRKRAGATAQVPNGAAPAAAVTLDLVDQAEEQAAESLRSPEPGSRAEDGGSTGRSEAAPADVTGGLEPDAADADAGADDEAGTEPAVREPGPAPQPADEPAARNGGEPSGAGHSAPPRSQPPRPVPQPPGPPGPGNHLHPPAPAQQQGAPGQPQAGQQPGQPGVPGEGGEVRRNRRRRGRDRDRLGAGYDQQAQQADQAYSGDPIPCDGLLELRPEGFGFLRTSGYVTGPDDVYVSMSQVRKFGLRAGDRIVGASRPATTQERFGALLRIDTVGGQSPDEARQRPRFDDLTPVFPDQRLTLGQGDPSDPASATGRIIDLVTPVGRGQRGTIVGPPGAGATTVLRHIAAAVEAHLPDVDLMVVLVDQRPEEVTDLSRSVKAEVIASPLDRQPEEHTHLAELVVEMAKRRAELGHDVVVLVDGLSRLVRAYNLAAPAGGRTLPSGIDTAALHPPKKMLAAARKLEEGGSLTIVATLVHESGSAVDAAIVDELQGVATMQLRLDGRLAERRQFPAVDVRRSSTARDDLLLSEDELRRVTELRRGLPGAAADGADPSVVQQLLS